MRKFLSQSEFWIILPLFIFTFLVYLLSNLNHPDWYKHFVYLADSFLKGKTYIEGYPKYYLDLILINGKAYLPNPPLPAIILLPFVAIWGVATDEVRTGNFIGAINVILVWVLLRKIGVPKIPRVLLTILFGFGTVHYSASIIGTIWFFAHVVTITFMLLALIEFFGKKRPFFMGLYLGLSFLARHPVILSIPFFIFPYIFATDTFNLKYISLSSLKISWKKLALFFLGIGLPLSFQAYYNTTRFGNPLESGYLLQNWYSSVQSGAIAKYGFFNLHYIPEHLFILLLKPPMFFDHFPFLKPSDFGMSIFLTTPAVLLAFKAKYFDRINFMALVSIVLILAPSLIYTATGWVQFGYRYSLDFWPFLLILIASGMGKKLNYYNVSLVILSVIINIWGNYWFV